MALVDSSIEGRRRFSIGSMLIAQFHLRDLGSYILSVALLTDIRNH